MSYQEPRPGRAGWTPGGPPRAVPVTTRSQKRPQRGLRRLLHAQVSLRQGIILLVVLGAVSSITVFSIVFGLRAHRQSRNEQRMQLIRQLEQEDAAKAAAQGIGQ